MWCGCSCSWWCTGCKRHHLPEHQKPRQCRGFFVVHRGLRATALQSWARVCNGRGYQAALGACPQANTPHQRPHSPASWPPTDPPRSRCGKLAGKRISQHQRAGIRQQAGLPRICHEAAVGSLLASEYPNTRAEGRIRQQAGLPRIMPRSRRGKLAGKRISQHQRAGIRQQAGLPRIRHEAAVGSLPASEYPNTREPEFASKLVSHRSATKPLWEACWQASIPTPEGRNSLASWPPTDPPRSRRGKLAGKRISQHQRCRNSPASWAPTDPLRSHCGKLAGKRIANGPGPSRPSGAPPGPLPTAAL